MKRYYYTMPPQTGCHNEKKCEGGLDSPKLDQIRDAFNCITLLCEKVKSVSTHIRNRYWNMVQSSFLGTMLKNKFVLDYFEYFNNNWTCYNLRKIFHRRCLVAFRRYTSKLSLQNA